MSELKPCPFCGGEAEFERTGTERQSCIVVCTNCGCRHESGDYGERSGRSWNTRATVYQADTHISEWKDWKPRLPRVQPEDLVEGKWYVVRIGKETAVLQAERRSGGGFMLLSRHYFSTESCTLSGNETIYGPLPEFELEET